MLTLEGFAFAFVMALANLPTKCLQQRDARLIPFLRAGRLRGLGAMPICKFTEGRLSGHLTL